MKAAIVILSDPKNGLEESAGRAFNALSAAYDFKRQGEDVTILFQGAGTRWIGELTKADHPFHALFETVKDKVAGVSSVLRLRKRVRRHGNRNAGGLRTGERQPSTGDSRATESPEADARGIHGTQFLKMRTNLQT